MGRGSVMMVSEVAVVVGEVFCFDLHAACVGSGCGEAEEWENQSGGEEGREG